MQRHSWASFQSHGQGVSQSGCNKRGKPVFPWHSRQQKQFPLPKRQGERGGRESGDDDGVARLSFPLCPSDLSAPSDTGYPISSPLFFLHFQHFPSRPPLQFFVRGSRHERLNSSDVLIKSYDSLFCHGS